jgi:hypothetical protein
MTSQRQFLGVVSVDSGILLVGDPAHVLPSSRDGQPGLDYQDVIKGDSRAQSIRLGGDVALLVQNFGGDGQFAVYGEFENGEFMRLVVDLEPLELGEDED